MDGYYWSKATATAVAEVLKSAGFNVIHHQHVGVVGVNFNGRIKYVTDETSRLNYGSVVTYLHYKHTISTGYTCIILNTDHAKEKYEFTLSENSANVCGKLFDFNTEPIDDQIGYLSDNIFTSYLNIFIFGSIRYDHQKLCNPEKFAESNKYYMLNKDDFTPVVARKVDIINKGIKFALNIKIMHIDNINNITVFGYDKYIISGNYSDLPHSGPFGPFGYINKDTGEQAALLLDPLTNIVTMVELSQTREVAKIKDFIVKEKDGLFDGYQLSWYSCYEYIEYARVYRFGDYFFAWSNHKNKYLICKARSPESGKHTKPALSAEIM